MTKTIRIGTRESQLAVWQAETVKALLHNLGQDSELVFIKSEGDTDLKTPLYELGVQGIFTRALDIALLKNEIDIAVHSMKDVPTVLAKGIIQAAVLPRGSYKDLLLPKTDTSFLTNDQPAVIATGSIRRKAQWLNRYPGHSVENLRGNVNTRLHKLAENNWNGAIFAAAGLERIGLRPENAIDLDWMLPAPAQGAIIVVCREADMNIHNICQAFHHTHTAICAGIERDFLRALSGGCSTPISALAEINDGYINFSGNILSVDGRQKIEITMIEPYEDAGNLGTIAGAKILEDGGQDILDGFKRGGTVNIFS